MMKNSQWIRENLRKAGILRPDISRTWREKIAYYLLGVSTSRHLEDIFRVVFADRQYTIFSLEENKAMIEKCRIDLIKWRPEVADCDNFAKLLTASIGVNFSNNSIGTVWGWVTDREGKRMKHAFNIFCIDTGEVYFLESQNDRVAKVEKGEAKIGNWKYFGVSRCWFF